jgi:hypothetical protein
MALKNELRLLLHFPVDGLAVGAARHEVLGRDRVDGSDFVAVAVSRVREWAYSESM